MIIALSFLHTYARFEINTLGVHDETPYVFAVKHLRCLSQNEGSCLEMQPDA